MSHNTTLILSSIFAMSLAFASGSLAQDNQLAVENYQQADANGDGVLVYAEFATLIDLNAADDIGNAAMVSSRGWHARAFQRIDANGDGIVSPQELQAIQ